MPDDLRDAADQHALLEQLGNEPGWALLERTFAERKQRYYDQLAKSLMAGREVDRQKLDYNRGFFDGVERLLSAPSHAAKTLERLVVEMKKHDTQTERE